MNRVKLRSYPNLSLWRNDRGWSQDQAAEYLGITQSQYSKWERGTSYPRGQKAKALHHKTGVPIVILLGAA